MSSNKFSKLALPFGAKQKSALLNFNRLHPRHRQQVSKISIRNQAGFSYTLSASKDREGEVIISSNGTLISIIPNALELHLDVADRKSGRVLFSGWSVDLKNSQTPESIVFFLEGKFFFSGTTKINRRDIVKHLFNPTLLTSGFEFMFPISRLNGRANPEIRIFALSKNGIASELHYPKWYRWAKK